MKASFLAPEASGYSYFCGTSGDSRLKRVSAGQVAPTENGELDLTVTNKQAFIVGIGSLLRGYDSGIFGTAQAQAYFKEKFNPSSEMLGSIISAYTAGGAIGCLIGGPIGNRFGRKE
jgi:hypothetical protein